MDGITGIDLMISSIINNNPFIKVINRGLLLSGLSQCSPCFSAFVFLKKYLRQSSAVVVRVNKHLLILVSVTFPGAHNLDLFSDFYFL